MAYQKNIEKSKSDENILSFFDLNLPQSEKLFQRLLNKLKFNTQWK